ncbi:alpha/beta hydrolase [Kitasatospora sp. NPDC002227]|uniref:alpha/beta hydrolase n=1 Tax=Kitasatospora sp. NPDC002227 TaxID=3154773 RepID=UPI00331C30DE
MRIEDKITTAFVLASGPFTDGSLWDAVSGRLGAAGAEVHAVTFSADPESHAGEVLRLIDSAAAPQVVLVGHDYGLHPLLAAARQRTGRVARIVHLDTAPPQDGDAPLALLPDPATQALLRDRPQALVPAPAPGEWARFGSTAGLTPEDLERLSALSEPCPGAVLTRPLRLTGALAAVPSSGILCTASGASIAGVQQLVSSGMPQFQALAEPSVGFFELATGHWPMLSCPEELTAALLLAAAGGGRRLTPAVTRPFHERPFVLDAAEAPRVRTGLVDLHLPAAEGPRPAVLLVHGGPLPRGLTPTPRDWPLYLGYARLLAGRGLVGAVLDHRLHGLSDYPTASEDLAEAVGLLRADPRVDPDRIALWFFSGAGLLLSPYLAAPAPWLRCVAATYPVLAPLPGWAGVDPAFDPAAALPMAGALPVVLTRAGLESPEIAATVAGFLDAADGCGAAVELVDAPHCRHGFDCSEPTEEARGAVRQAMEAVCAHLSGRVPIRD